MAIDYPNSPTNGQIYTVGEKSWIWDGTTWLAYGASLSPSVLKVDSVNNRVGINNQSPDASLDVQATTGTAMRITNTGTGNCLLVEDAAGDIAPFVINADGNVGMGVSNPLARLHITDGQANIRLNLPSVSADSFNIAPSVSGTNGYSLTLRPAVLTGYHTVTLPSATGTVITTGNLSSITSVGTLGSLTVTGDVTVDTNTLKVDSTNNRVGIANASPAYTLDVNGTIEGTQFIQGTDYLSPYQGFRNKIINGDFSIWQRSTSTGFGSSAFIGAADRWYHVSGVSYGMAIINRETLAPGTIPGYDAQYFLGSANYNYSANFFSQRIEDVRTLAGRTVTLSFWVNNFGYGNNIISSSLTQNFGTGGSTAVSTNFSNVPTTSGWVRQSLTVTLPSISGKTIGTNSYLQLQFSTNGHYFVGIAGVQLEEGSVATPFEHRPIQQELALCQRYFQKSYSLATAPGTATESGQYAFYGTGNVYALLLGTTQLRVPMRVAPTTVTYYRSDAANTVGWSWFNTGGSSGTGTPTTLYASETSFTTYLSITTSYGSGGIYGNWIASAEL